MNERTSAFAIAIGLLGMAILAPFAQFGVLATIIVAADPAKTAANIAASPGLFSAAIAAFAVVAVLDLVVAWGIIRVFARSDRQLAAVVGWSRIVYAAIFAFSLTGLVGASQAVTDSAGVESSIASFHRIWDIGLVLFGAHLFVLAALLWRSAMFPRFLAALVAVAGAGYLVDSLGRLLVSGYGLSISTYTFIGEALLIIWFFKIAIQRRSPERRSSLAVLPAST